MDPIEEAKARRQVSPAEAREQAAEYLGFTASKEIVLETGEVFEIPNPGLLDDDQQERFEELQAELDTFDHEEVEVPIIEYVVEQRNVTEKFRAQSAQNFRTSCAVKPSLSGNAKPSNPFKLVSPTPKSSAQHHKA